MDNNSPVIPVPLKRDKPGSNLIPNLFQFPAYKGMTTMRKGTAP